MAIDGKHARMYPNIQQLLKDELAYDEDLQALSESERQASLDSLAVIWHAADILKDAAIESYMYMVGHGMSESEASEMLLQFKEELD